jgi:polyisoprenoid-binding protein YceI
MRFLVTLFAIFFFHVAAFAAPQAFTLDPTHTNVVWKASHFGFSLAIGKFTDVKGTLNLDEENPENSTVAITLKTASLTTGQKKFDDHLKSADFFDVKKFPTASFTSTKIEKTGENTAAVTGDFTLKGITKPLVLNVTLNKIDINPFTNKKTAGFSADGVIKRSDFGIIYSLPGIADEVKLHIEAEAFIP